MDIDCDGIQKKPNSGRCGTNPSDQSVTSFSATVKSYNIAGLTDLDPYIHPYVVFGNSGAKPRNVPFDPKDYGIQPLSVMAIVTKNKLVSISQPARHVRCFTSDRSLTKL